MHQRLKLWTLAATLAAAASTGAMAQGYSILNLGALSVAALNDIGQVAGTHYLDTNSLAFYTGANGIGLNYVTLPSGGNWSYASDINNLGQVVGSYQTSTLTGVVHGFVTGPIGQGATDFGLPPAVQTTRITAIDDQGRMAGTAPPVELNGLGTFITDAGGTNAHALPFASYANVMDMNANGRVIAINDDHAYITGANGVGITQLGTLGGSATYAQALNATGRVVGASQTSTGIWHAYVTGSNGVGMVDLGKTSFGNLGGDEGSAAVDINDLGQIIGNSTKGLGENPSPHVYITGANAQGVVDLNSLATLPDGLFFSYAIAINNVGQLLVRDNFLNSYLLTPIPEAHTSAMMVVGLLGIGAAMRRSKRNAKRTTAVRG